MYIKKLLLENFRNYKSVNIEFEKNKILFIGKNAQGKTNLLEAIYFLATLNSFRAKSDSELIKTGEDVCKIRSELERYDTEVSVEAILQNAGRKKLKVNDLAKNKFSDFLGNISAVCFTINDLLLLRGTPDDRRTWLDNTICQIYPAYAERITKYNKIKTQKNNYLKSLKGNLDTDCTLLDVWNEQLAITGSNIIFIRLNFLHEIQKIAEEKHKLISPSENLTFNYVSSIIGEIPSNEKYEKGIEFILKSFQDKLEEKKREEIIRAQSVTGAHRDDISFFINQFDAKKYSSQGQQRTLVIALKLAELDIIKQKTGTDAVLLLDDVLAELDDIRQNFLLNAIGENIQTVITSVDTLHFKEEYLKNVEIFEIKNNEINKLSGGFTV